jgi:Tudor domain
MKNSSQLQIRKIQKNMSVAVHCREKWHRGEVLAWTDDDVFVLFVDFGLREHIKMKNLRILKDDFISQPRMACKGSLHDVKPPNNEVLWDVKTIIKFIGRVKDQKIYATVQDLVDGYYKLTLIDDITNNTLFKDSMIKKGLAEASDCVGLMNAILVSKFHYLQNCILTNLIFSRLKLSI